MISPSAMKLSADGCRRRVRKLRWMSVRLMWGETLARSGPPTSIAGGTLSLLFTMSGTPAFRATILLIFRCRRRHPCHIISDYRSASFSSHTNYPVLATQLPSKTTGPRFSPIPSTNNSSTSASQRSSRASTVYADERRDANSRIYSQPLVAHQRSGDTFH